MSRNVVRNTSRNVAEGQIQKSRGLFLGTIQIREVRSEITDHSVFIRIRFSILPEHILVSYRDLFRECISRLRQRIDRPQKCQEDYIRSREAENYKLYDGFPRFLVESTPRRSGS